jgi:hypothetical protein
MVESGLEAVQRSGDSHVPHRNTDPGLPGSGIVATKLGNDGPKSVKIPILLDMPGLAAFLLANCTLAAGAAPSGRFLAFTHQSVGFHERFPYPARHDRPVLP